MKANELMIGDWVLVQDTLRKVAQLTKHKIGYHLTDKECVMHYARLCEIKPIPLTAEILEKNGFSIGGRYDESGNCTKKVYAVLKTDECTIWIHLLAEDNYVSNILNHKFTALESWNMKFPIQYVHTLQHTLRLCGLDDLADNLIIN